MKTLVALMALCKGDSIKNRHFAQEWSERDEKSTNRKKDPKTLAKKWDPYNAPPSTRRM
ncbi:hypothetical protein IVU49_24160 [Salmonella enterica subsp. enterica serovar Worthington]|nr:hypothetical protein [Salmonella enterica subsp. enterica serovar Worthington]